MGRLDTQERLIPLEYKTLEAQFEKRNSVKGYFYILALTAVLMTMTGCNKWDCNGDLDGMWQMTEWRDKDGTVKATKEDMIFYSFQLQMASFRKENGERFFIRTMLEASPERILIYDPAEYVGNKHEEVKPMSVLSVVGVPEDGVLWVQTLTGSSMVLKTNTQDILTFRKY